MTTCGTGGWGGPLPGDPNNNSILSATSGFGGIDVSWTYPTTNPFAVAHTILYRSTTASVGSAIQRAVVSGGFFHDDITVSVNTTYYYWIKLVSINGTEGALIGPASAVAKPRINDILTDLTGKIDRSTLGLALKGELDAVPTVMGNLSAEITNRINADLALATTVTTIDGKATTALATANSFDIARIADNTAMAAHVDYVAAGIGDDLATVQTNMMAVTSVIDGKVAEIGALYTVNLTVNGLVGGFGVYNDGKSVDAGFDVDTFWVGKTIPMWVTGTVYALGDLRSLGGANWKCILAHTASAINKPPTLPTTSNTWWVKDNSRLKPFIISGDVVYINTAVIQDASITNAKISNLSVTKLTAGSLAVGVDIASTAYTAGSAGWKIKADGSAEFNNLKVRGEIMGGDYTGYAWPAYTGHTGFYLGPQGLLLGNQLDGKYFQVTSAGNMYAPGFSIVNGVMSIAQVNVIGTGQIIAGAVGSPIGTSVPSDTWLTTTETTYMAVSIDTSNRGLWVHSRVGIRGSSDTITVKLYVGGVEKYSESFGVSGSGNNSMSTDRDPGTAPNANLTIAEYIASPGSGSVLVEVKLFHSVGAIACKIIADSNLFAIGTKR